MKAIKVTQHYHSRPQPHPHLAGGAVEGEEGSESAFAGSMKGPMTDIVEITDLRMKKSIQLPCFSSWDFQSTSIVVRYRLWRRR